MNAEMETVQVDANLVIEAIEIQRNSALGQAAMAVARNSQLAAENKDLKNQTLSLQELIAKTDAVVAKQVVEITALKDELAGLKGAREIPDLATG